MRKLVTGLMMLALILPVQVAAVSLDGIVALVDEDVILNSELKSRLEQVRQSFAARGARIDDEETLPGQVLERIIIENLQIQMARRGGVRINDEELNQAMARIAAQNGMNMAEFRQALGQDGISYARTREQIRQEIMISQVQQGILRGRIHISDQEISSFLESEQGQLLTADEYRLLHLLLPLPEEPERTEVIRQHGKAEEIMAQTETVADFQRMALTHSSGQKALEGGDLGWRKLAQMPSLFADRVPGMRVGAIEGPIRSGSGFHIIMLQDKRGVSVEGRVPQTHARHILIQPSEILSREEARDLAESVRNLVVDDGRDFAELAKLYSDDPGSALAGGDLGWNRAGIFVPAFEQVLGQLQLDELSEVFETAHGFHFVQLTGRRIEDFSDEFRRGLAESFLRERKFEEELETWLREIREEAFVEIRI